jgi:hypothetical protein
LEKAVRDYIAKHPWLISPEWETFRVEKSMGKVISAAAKEAQLSKSDWKGRMDLVLASGDHLLVLEFMRPGITLDWEHLSRFEHYIRTIRGKIEPNTAGLFSRATGYAIADGLAKHPEITAKLRSLATEAMYAMDWPTMFSRALSLWREFLEALADRDPDDERLQALLKE